MEEKKNGNQPSEIGDEKLDKVAGGVGNPVILDVTFGDFFAGMPNLLPKRKNEVASEEIAGEIISGSDA